MDAPSLSRSWRQPPALAITAAHRDRMSRRPADGLSRRGEAWLARLPIPHLWEMIWRAEVGVHWAFWSLFAGPIVVLAVLANALPELAELMDVMGLAWVVAGAVLIWRAGYGHAGYAWTPVIYRVVIALYITAMCLFIGAKVLG